MTDKEKVIEHIMDYINAVDGLTNVQWVLAELDILKDALTLLKAQESIEARLHLCDSCTKLYPECDATADGIEFGCGFGNDNIIGCTAYENRWKAQEPRLVTESDFDGADEYGYIPVWTSSISAAILMAGFIAYSGD